MKMIPMARARFLKRGAMHPLYGLLLTMWSPLQGLNLRRRLAVAAAAVGASVAAAGCGGGTTPGTTGQTGAPPATEKAERSFTIYAETYTHIPYYESIFAGYRYAAKRYGWTVVEEYGNTTPERQYSQVETALARHPDAILVSPMNEQVLVPVVEQAHRQGIIVMAVANYVNAPDALLTYLGTPNTEIGRLKAQYIVEKLHGKGKVALVNGIHGHTYSEEQAKGAADVFKKYHGIQIVADYWAGGFSSDLGAQKTENLITAHPDVNAIYYADDDLALGGLQVLKERGLLGKVVIVGGDGLADGLAAVRRGELGQDVSICGFWTGIKAIELLHDYVVNHVKPPAHLDAKIIEFTPSNIEEKMASLKPTDCDPWASAAGNAGTEG